MSALGEILREGRRREGLTQEQAARRVGRSIRTWQRWEAGHNRIPLSALLDVARLLALTVEAIVRAIGKDRPRDPR